MHLDGFLEITLQVFIQELLQTLLQGYIPKFYEDSFRYFSKDLLNFHRGKNSTRLYLGNSENILKFFQRFIPALLYTGIPALFSSDVYPMVSKKIPLSNHTHILRRIPPGNLIKKSFQISLRIAIEFFQLIPSSTLQRLLFGIPPLIPSESPLRELPRTPPRITLEIPPVLVSVTSPRIFQKLLQGLVILHEILQKFFKVSVKNSSKHSLKSLQKNPTGIPSRIATVPEIILKISPKFSPSISQKNLQQDCISNFFIFFRSSSKTCLKKSLRHGVSDLLACGAFFGNKSLRGVHASLLSEKKNAIGNLSKNLFMHDESQIHSLVVEIFSPH